MDTVQISRGGVVLTVARKAFNVIYRNKGFTIVGDEPKIDSTAEASKEIADQAEKRDDQLTSPAPPSARSARKSAAARKAAAKDKV